MKKSLCLSICLALLFVLVFQASRGATYTVTNVNNSGAGSLRQAIVDANLLTPGIADMIVFNIAPGGFQSIKPMSQLPELTDPAGVFIDGFTQPGGATAGSNPPSTAVLLIEIDGSVCQPGPTANGFVIQSPNNTIRGLIINNFADNGIVIRPTPSGTFNNLVYCNFIGTDQSGTLSRGNGTNNQPWFAGILIGLEIGQGGGGTVHDNTVEANLISSNSKGGVEIFGGLPSIDAYFNHVIGNYIGTDRSGMLPLGNIMEGVCIAETARHNIVDGNLISANGCEGVSIFGFANYTFTTHGNTVSNNIIGLNISLSPMGNGSDGVNIGMYGANQSPQYYLSGWATGNIIGPGNIISANGRNGVCVWEDGSSPLNADSNRITHNSIYGNGNLGIDLADDNVTLNDLNDPDGGPNQWLNFPVITSVVVNAGQTTISGTLNIDSNPASAVVELFSLTSPDPLGYGEGNTYLTQVTPLASGNWSVTVTGAVAGNFLSATATDVNHNTSEFSQAVPIIQELDFGDCPDPTYPTLLASNGARHAIDGVTFLGSRVDAEPDGQPNAQALGDDNNSPNPPPNDDEDGVVFWGPIVYVEQATFTVTASVQGYLNAWFDVGSTGSWSNPAQHVLTDVLIPAGPTTFSVFIGLPTFNSPVMNARFRFSTVPGLGFTGFAPDGEVEDYQVPVASMDFGDCPDPTYPTLWANNGARHAIDGVTFLGSLVDGESDGQPDNLALGDDNSGPGIPPLDDEDGVVFLSPIQFGQGTTFTVTASVQGYLNGWFDLNGNGTFSDPGEQLFTDALIPAGLSTMAVFIPVPAINFSMMYARFRFCTYPGAGFAGFASNGEVEDYQEWVLPPRDYGDAPEGTAAYPPSGVTGSFPTCRVTGPAGWIGHDATNAWFGPNADLEPEGNAGFCPVFAPNSYNMDECFNDSDAGLTNPSGYTITGGASPSITPCVPGQVIPLGNACQWASWGPGNIDILVNNALPGGTPAYVNVLMDWNRNGQWGGSFYCPGGAAAPEHVLQNFVIPNPFSGLLSSLSPPQFLLGPSPGYVWTRFTITEQPVFVPWMGDGIFGEGETEDYLLQLMTGAAIPDSLLVRNVTIPNGVSRCFEAVNKITVAGSNTTVTVQPGGEVHFIASQKIIFLPLTKVMSGGKLHAYITTDGNYCNLIRSPSIAAGELSSYEQVVEENPVTLKVIRVYPNPTTGELTLVMPQQCGQLPVTAEIYSLMGRKIISQLFAGSDTYVLSLDALPKGIYILRVITGDETFTAKIIRQ